MDLALFFANLLFLIVGLFLSVVSIKSLRRNHRRLHHLRDVSDEVVNDFDASVLFCAIAIAWTIAQLVCMVVEALVGDLTLLQQVMIEVPTDLFIVLLGVVATHYVDMAVETGRTIERNKSSLVG